MALKHGQLTAPQADAEAVALHINKFAQRAGQYVGSPAFKHTV